MFRVALATLLLLTLLSCAPPREQPSETDVAYLVDPARRPNVIVIVVDDLRWDEMGVAGHPFLETPNLDALAAEGAYFENAFHTVPLCSPNRASLLTGQYPSRHGIIDNVARNRMSHHLQTFPQALQADGYETAFLGKWHMGNDPTPRPGFDYWVAIPGQGRTTDPELYEDGRLHTVPGYITDVLTDRAVDFIGQERERPFLLYLAHKAVHPDAVQLDDGSVDPNVPSRYVPAPRHRGRYEDEVLPPRPNVISSPDELVGKPALQRALREKTSPAMLEEFGEAGLGLGNGHETIVRRAEMTLAVDESLGRIVQALRDEGILDDTFILFTSDNGFFYGEHDLTLERRLPYEESIRMPLIVRFPRVAEPGERVEDLVASIDLAPTILEVAGTPVGDQIQGRSFLPLLLGDRSHARESVLVEFYTYENPFPWLLDMDYRALRTDRYKLVHWMQHPQEEELYDLEQDPYEMGNLIDDPAMAGVIRELRSRLRTEVLQALGLG